MTELVLEDSYKVYPLPTVLWLPSLRIWEGTDENSRYPPETWCVCNARHRL